MDIVGLYHDGLLETGTEVQFAGVENMGRTTVVTFNRRTGLLVLHTTGSQWQNLGKVNKTAAYFSVLISTDEPMRRDLVRPPTTVWQHMGEFDVRWRER